MSAQIPSTMKLKDLLKPSGYDCPEELLDKTFEEATSGGDTKISTNTAATVDVSQYTGPVKITPAEGYDATEKVTLNLTNIPAGGVSTLYAWSNEVDFLYTTTPTPNVGDIIVLSSNSASGIYTEQVASVTEEGITYDGSSGVFARSSEGDVQLS